ncbi:MAG: amino acid ABC transporter ATP-binding protein [Lachnospiraceae bacterium]|nr:amino acid ABC transporter ATP-binding protein [Lachnospiraceae bacterium]
MAQQPVLLEVKNIVKNYGEGNVLDGVSLELRKGEVKVVIGPSGCGKSTLLRCINGLEKIQAGQILLTGNVLTEGKTDWSKVRQKIGMVFQSYDLFPHMSVLDNITLGPVKVQGREKKEVVLEAEKLLGRVGLLDKKDAYPRQLSGGQKQRVAIVRALILKPEILLFDEVTAALDPEMVREVLDVILELADDGYTMLIVTHEMQFARAVADQVVFLDGGRIVESDAPEQFFTQPKAERARRFLNTFVYEKGGEKA